MVFVLEWVTFYLAIMFAMCVDNIFWISASPEYVQYKRWKLGTKIKYILKDRVLVVLTHPRDIMPAIITSFILTLIL